MSKKKKKNLKLNMSNLYIVLACMFVLGFGFFGVSKLFMAEDVAINQSELNKEFDLKSNGKFTITSWIYDADQKMMEITLVTNGIRDYLTRLEFTAVSHKNLSAELPTEIVYDDSDIYIIHVKDVPKDFNQMAVRFNIGEKSYEDLFSEEGAAEDQSKVISTIYADQRVIETQPIKDRSFREYALEITGEMIEESEQSIAELEQNNLMLDGIIEEINKEIELLKVDLLYQTVDEQVETNNTVFGLEKNIEGYESDKQTLSDDIQNIRAKIERLKQKQYDLNI